MLQAVDDAVGVVVGGVDTPVASGMGVRDVLDAVSNLEGIQPQQLQQQLICATNRHRHHITRPTATDTDKMSRT